MSDTEAPFAPNDGYMVWVDYELVVMLLGIIEHFK